MTTNYSFFNKVFSENEKAKHLYKDSDFSQMSPDQIYFLEKLSIISKHKDFIKSFLMKKKIPDREKLDYIQLYKPSLTYPEYIKFNMMVEENENNFVNSWYVVGCVNFMAFVYLIVKKEPQQPLMKEMTMAFGASMFIGWGFRKYYKKNYKKTLDELYINLEKRMNENPDMKNCINNNNFVSEENYDEMMDDSY